MFFQKTPIDVSKTGADGIPPPTRVTRVGGIPLQETLPHARVTHLSLADRLRGLLRFSVSDARIGESATSRYRP
jgi:hypothetical protein